MTDADAVRGVDQAVVVGDEPHSSLLAHLQVGVVVHGPDTGILYANPRAAELLGLSVVELMGLTATAPAWCFVREDGTELPLADYPVRRALDERRPLEGLVLGVDRADGKRAWVQANAHAEFRDDGALLRVIVTFSDVTERKSFEDALLFLAQGTSSASGEDFFRALARYLARSLPVDFVCIDQLEGAGLLARTLAVYHDGEFEDNVTYALKETPCGVLVGKTTCAFPRGVARLFPHDEVLQQLGAESYVGSTLWSATGQPIGLIAAIGTRPMGDTRMAESLLRVASMRAAGELERRQAEEAQRASEARFRGICQSSPMGIAIADIATQRFQFANEAFLEMVGYSLDELRGLTLQDVTHPDDWEEEVQLIRAQFREKARPRPFQKRYVRKDGQVRQVELIGDVIESPDGVPTQAVANVTDITQRLQLEERLRHSEKMEAIGRLAGGVAHDFNNQLTGILGYAEMLTTLLEDPRLRRFADNIMRASRRAADLTAQLLAFARKGKYISVPVDIHKMLSEVVALLEHSLDKRIEIRLVLAAHPHLVLGDPTQLQNAFLNLAVNARDAMPKGGELAFVTSVASLEAEEDSPDLPAGRYLLVSVSDSGTGMDAEVLDHLFEPFFTTKDQGEGTGLGLAAVHGTVRSHRGSIGVRSEVGVGTTFSVYLPLHEQPGEPHDEADSPEAVPGKARILVVEDEAMVRDLVADLLRDLGYRVVTCVNGEEAIAWYRESWPSVDVVILDMVMPRLGGYDTFVAMREIHPGIKALLVSGHSIEGEAQSILDEGVLGFVQKPFARADLSRKVAEALQGGRIR